MHQFRVLGIEKIDAGPIFAFLAQPQILGLCFQDVENRRGIDFFDAQRLRLACKKFWHINSSPAPKYGGQTPWIGPAIAKWMLCAKPILSVFFITSNFSVAFFSCSYNPNSVWHVYYWQSYLRGPEIWVRNSQPNVHMTVNRGWCNFWFSKCEWFCTNKTCLAKNYDWRLEKCVCTFQ